MDGPSAAVPQGDDVLFSPADSLSDVALASRAPSTSFKYSYTYNRWKSWACDHQGSYPFSKTNFQDFSRTFQGLGLIF